MGAIDVILIKLLIKQSNTINTTHAKGAGMQTDGSALTAAGSLGALLNPYLSSDPVNHDANQRRFKFLVVSNFQKEFSYITHAPWGPTASESVYQGLKLRFSPVPNQVKMETS